VLTVLPIPLEMKALVLVVVLLLQRGETNDNSHLIIVLTF